MTLFTPPTDGALIAAYDRGWESRNKATTVPVQEAAALRNVARTTQRLAAEAVEDLVDSADDHVDKGEILGKLSELARELRERAGG